MKKRFGMLATIMIVVMLITGALSGCGSKAPTEQDAKKYVQATLDLLCTGKYDNSVELVDVEKGKETEMRDELIDSIVSEFAGQAGITDGAQEQFRSFIDKAFATSKYTVKDAVKTDDNGKVGYDVTVSIEPLKVFSGVQGAMQEELTDIASNPDSVKGMSQDEIYKLVYDAMFKALDTNLENPQYAAPEDVVVHYGLIDKEKNVYGVSEADGNKLGEKFFSLEGMTQ